MGFLRWVAKPRLNYFGLLGVAIATGLYLNGYWVQWIAVCAVTALLSVYLERKAGFQ